MAGMQQVINASWSPLRSYMGGSAAQRLILSGQTGALLEGMPWADWLYNLAPIQPAVEQAVSKSAVKGAKALGMSGSFDVLDEISFRYASEQSGKLIKNLADTTRASVRFIIGDAMAGNRTVDSAARALRSVVGLHPAWAQAVAKHGDRTLARALKDGVPEVKARAMQEKAMERHAAKLTRIRAQNIARTEIQTASNIGTYASWEHAIGNGYAEPESLKEWNPGPGACGICAPISGERVRWDQPFSNGVMMPPGHPSCRCSATLLPPDFKAKPLNWTDPAPRTAPDIPRPAQQPGSGKKLTSLGGEEVRALQESDMPVKLGKPLSITEAVKANPARQTGVARTDFDDARFSKYQNNCTSCANAYELRRRGYDVYAADTNRVGRKDSEWVSSWWHTPDGKPVSMNRFWRKADMKEWAAEQPEGARGFLSVAWSRGGGHALNWEKAMGKNGKLVFRVVDPQSGELMSLTDLSKNVLPHGMSAIRTDNLIPNQRVLQAITEEQR